MIWIFFLLILNFQEQNASTSTGNFVFVNSVKFSLNKIKLIEKRKPYIYL